MARRPREPRWLSRIVADAIHDDQIREHGGLPGIRDENALESALARPRNKWLYGKERDPAALAAGYGFGLITNHPYADGNKRVGANAAITFLLMNNLEPTFDEEELADLVLSVASGGLSKLGLTQVFESRCKPLENCDDFRLGIR